MSGAPADLSVLDSPICGMTWGWVGTRGSWATEAAEFSMAQLADHGANWVAVAYAALQETPFSTDVHFAEAPVVTDDEVVWAIREAKRLGLKVCLKPVVNCADGAWRANIGFLDPDVPGEPTWDAWFQSYGEFILHSARIAQTEGAEMFCIGCEMVRADAKESQWRQLIAQVREVYTGIVTYNCDKYQEDRLSWWDAVDVITSSGYYPIDAWEQQLDRIEAVVTASGKPFFFMEAGCPSRVGSPDKPNDWSLPGAPSGDEQLRYYQAMFDACAARDWVGGFMLWDWPAQLYAHGDAAENDDYCPYGKPAGQWLRERYRSMTEGITA